MHIKIYIRRLISWIDLTELYEPGDGSYTSNNPAGLLSGIWHGWIAPLSLIFSIFNKSISIYETINTGFWYDFGFYMAVISGFGGLLLYRNTCIG